MDGQLFRYVIIRFRPDTKELSYSQLCMLLIWCSHFQIICLCGKDEEQWVRVMAEVVKPLLETQSLEASVSGSIHNDVMETLRSVCE